MNKIRQAALGTQEKPHERKRTLNQMTVINPPKVETLCRSRAVTESERHYASVMAELKAGDAERWVKLHRDEYGWPIFLDWNPTGGPSLGCLSSDTADVLRSFQPEWIASIIKYLDHEWRLAQVEDFERIKELPFVLTAESKAGSSVTSYWPSRTRDKSRVPVKGMKAYRRGQEFAGALFQLRASAGPERVLGHVLREIVRSGRDLNHPTSQLERGFLEMLGDLVHECALHQPWLLRRVIHKAERTWSVLAPNVEREQAMSSTRTRKAARAR